MPHIFSVVDRVCCECEQYINNDGVVLGIVNPVKAEKISHGYCIGCYTTAMQKLQEHINNRNQAQY